MKKITILVISVLLILSVCVNSYAKKLQGSDSEKNIKSGRKLESWYHVLTFGYVPSLKMNGSKPKVDVTAINIDFLRFYFPISSKILLGIGINGTGIQINGDSSYQENYYLYSASLQYYLNQIGKGVFIRGDVGLSEAAALNTHTHETDRTEMSHGFMLGLGFALPISQETSLLFQVQYRNLDIKFDDFKATYEDVSFSVGWLW